MEKNIKSGSATYCGSIVRGVSFSPEDEAFLDELRDKLCPDMTLSTFKYYVAEWPRLKT